MTESTALNDPVLLNEWMAVAESKDIVDPTKVFVLGHELVLWRDSKGIRAFKNLCIHRGTALSLGSVQNDELICPYHGWRYDGAGQCTHIPAQPDLPIPTKARAFNYHCQEKYGLVWVCLGEPSQDVPSFLEADDASYHTIVCGPYVVNAEAPRIIENFLDVSHLMWVHEGFLGVPEHATIPEYHVHEKDGTLVSDTIRVFQPDPDGRGKDVNNDYIYSALRPMTVKFTKTDDQGSDAFAIMLHTTPLAYRQTKAYAVLTRNYGFDMDDQLFRDFQDKIFSQDETILLSQRPEELPLDLAAELHIKSDRLAIAYRKWLADLGVQVGVA